MRVLVVNAGSSSLKLRLLDDSDHLARSVDLSAGDQGIDVDALATSLGSWPSPDVVGHRIVHGGRLFSGPVIVDSTVRQSLEDLTDLAPLHQPKSLEALDAVSTLLPGVPAVACFDTAFHTTIPLAASTYAIPEQWRQRYGVRRYGFHGLSHAYAARRTATLLDRPVKDLRIISCHLGAGSSLCAILGGHSVDTTMGFTPLEGVVMATRSGSVDPGLVLWLEEHEKLSPHEVADALEHRSGLMALAGTGDMRQIEASALNGDERALLALDIHLHSLVAAISAMCASTGGIDALAFTGGVGENSARLRRQAVHRLAYLGLDIDDECNRDSAPDRDISSLLAHARTVVIASREDLQIAGEVRGLMSSQQR